MTGLFLHALWGDERTPRRAKVLDDIQRAAAAPHKPEPCVCYAYGPENARVLEEAGFKTQMVWPEPLADWGSGCPRGDDVHMPYGRSIWTHKLHSIARATFGPVEAVCWLDWDCRLTKPLPADWWAQMTKGATFQSPLSRYKRPKCPWRMQPGEKQGFFGQAGIVPSGSFVYCRDRQVALSLFLEQGRHPDWYDEQVYAWITDEMTMGWHGAGHYALSGHQPPGVCVHRAVFRPRPDETLFYAPLRWRKKEAS